MTLLSIDSLHLVDSGVKNKGSTDDGVRTWSTAVQILLPVAALAILWGRRGFFARFFLQFDKNCVSVFCPPFSKRQRLLKWASGRLPPTWSSHANTFPEGPVEFWRDGSLLCTLINSAIPGACPNPHRHWKRPPSHGQALAYKYLGVAPVFTENELAQNGLSLRNEAALINYLLKIQQAITNLSSGELKFSSRYVARGMGLVVGEEQRKTNFYIYSSSTTSSSKHDVMVSIRGPYNTHCTATIPAYYISRKHLHNQFEDKQRLTFKSKAQRSFLRTLSVDLGSFIHLNQTPDIDNNIPIKLVAENERVKVEFIPKFSGVHEISIITNAFHLVGSPFNVNVTENTSEVQDTINESFRYPYRKIKTQGMKKNIRDFTDESVLINSLDERNIPMIKITQTEDNCQEIILDEEILTNTDNTYEDLEDTSKSIQNFNFLLNDATEKTARNVENFELVSEVNDATTENYCTNQSNIVKELLDTEFNSNTSNAEEIINNDLNIAANFLNDDYNNNFTVVDSINSLNQVALPTSPICLDHIEEEVINESNGSLEAPNWNFEKKRVRRQNKIDLSDELDIGDHDPEFNATFFVTLNNEQNINENQMEDELQETDWQMLEKNTIYHEGIPSMVDSSTSSSNKFVANEINENLAEENIKHDFATKNQTETGLERDISSGPNSMNILNYLSSLKTEESNSNNIETHHTAKSKLSNLPERSMSVKQRLQYWESQANLHISNKKHKLRLRRSLPNLLPSSALQLLPFTVQNHDNETPKYQNNPEAVEFKSQFKDCQEYWKILSSQSIDCSSIPSSTYYLQTRGKVNKFEMKSRRSLPDLFSKVSRSEVFDAMSYRNICFPIDFFDSPDAAKFKTRFKECREFWEKLSTLNLDFKASYESIDTDRYNQENFDDSNFDSGFYNSLPNLSSKNEDSFDQNDSLKFKRQYEERREYWERLSLHSTSDLSINSLLSTENNIADDVLGIKPILFKSVNETQQKKLKTISETSKDVLEKSSLRNDFCHSQDDKQWTNLTDDLKEINDQREKMKMHFDQAKQFFKNLEETIK